MTIHPRMAEHYGGMRRLAVLAAGAVLTALLTPATAQAVPLQCRTDPLGAGTVKTCYQDGEAVWELTCNAYGSGCVYHICGVGGPCRMEHP